MDSVLVMASLIFFLILLLGSAHKASSAAEKSLYVFGDSLFDAGNNQYYVPTVYTPANHYPYGISFTSATGRYSDGLLVPDFIARFESMPLIPPALDPDADGSFGYNFASAGSGVLYHPDAMNLFEQLAVYKNLTGGNDTIKESVYLFCTGGNDYLGYITDNINATEQDMQNEVDDVIGGLKYVIQEIYLTGGRKFAFQDVEPLGCSPMSKYLFGLSEGCYEDLNTIAKLHNIALRKALANFTDINYGVLDYYNHIYLRINSPIKYGFKDSEVTCCGYGAKMNAEHCGTTPYFLCSNPGSFVFFDGPHTTQALNSQMAELMWTGNQSIIYPYNVRQLFQMKVDVNDHDDH